MNRIAVACVILATASACSEPESPAAAISFPGTSVSAGGFPMRFAMIARCGSSVEVRVPAKANIFGAGIAQLPQPAGGGGGVSPICVNVPLQVATLTVERTAGAVSFSRHPGFSDGAPGSFFHRCSFGTDAEVRVVIGPDGVTTDACGGAAGLGGAIEPAGLVSGITSSDRVAYLVGVFLPDAPVTATPPEGLDLEARYEVERFAPMLQQVFFIGDGRTSAGALQRFRVPVGATRLYLGYADAFGFLGPPGYYGDNYGSLTTTLSFD